MINLMVAMPAEARPLIDHMRLKADSRPGPFNLYRNEQCRLLVTGMGQVAMAAGCGWMAGQGEASDDVWLNVGVAGHRSLALGELRVANRISDEQLDRHWYPPQLIDELRGEALRTVMEPSKDYPLSCLYDMEASAFVAICSRFCTSELVQVLKVVSDNQDHPLEHFDVKAAAGLIAHNAPAIASYAAALCELGRGYYQQSEIDGLAEIEQEILARWHFTSTRKTQLHGLLRRWFALAPAGQKPVPFEFSACSDAAAFLQQLGRAVDQLPVTVDS